MTPRGRPNGSPARCSWLVLLPEIDETVPEASLRQDVLRVAGIGLDLLSQVVDIKPDVMGLLAVLIAPHFGQQRLVGQDPPRVAYQMVAVSYTHLRAHE